MTSTRDTLAQRRLERVSGDGAYAQFADTVISCTLDRGSVMLRARVLVSMPVPTCTTTFWATDSCIVPGVLYDTNDTLVIRSGTDVIRLQDTSFTPTVRIEPARLPQASRGIRITDRAGRRFDISTPTSASGGVLEIFDAAGRQVCAVDTRSREITIPARLGPGLYRVRMRGDRLAGAWSTPFMVAR